MGNQLDLSRNNTHAYLSNKNIPLKDFITKFDTEGDTFFNIESLLFLALYNQKFEIAYFLLTDKRNILKNYTNEQLIGCIESIFGKNNDNRVSRKTYFKTFANRIQIFSLIIARNKFNYNEQKEIVLKILKGPYDNFTTLNSILRIAYDHQFHNIDKLMEDILSNSVISESDTPIIKDVINNENVGFIEYVLKYHKSFSNQINDYLLKVIGAYSIFRRYDFMHYLLKNYDNTILYEKIFKLAVRDDDYHIANLVYNNVPNKDEFKNDIVNAYGWQIIDDYVIETPDFKINPNIHVNGYESLLYYSILNKHILTIKLLIAGNAKIEYVNDKKENIDLTKLSNDDEINKVITDALQKRNKLNLAILSTGTNKDGTKTDSALLNAKNSPYYDENINLITNQFLGGKRRIKLRKFK